MYCRLKGPVRVYLSYVDDSAATDTRSRYAVFAAIIIPSERFFLLEQAVIISSASLVTGTNLNEPQEEFRARDLFKGSGAFASVPSNLRHDAIRKALFHVKECLDLVITYGAVDREAIKEMLVASIDPADVAFRQCVLGIEKSVSDLEIQNRHSESSVLREMHDRSTSSNAFNEVCMLILDDTGDSPLKDRLKATYRMLRKKPRLGSLDRGQLYHLHDGLFFGDSKESIGIQLADLSAYFIGLHLSGKADASGEAFYKIIEPRIANSGVFPSAIGHEIKTS